MELKRTHSNVAFVENFCINNSIYLCDWSVDIHNFILWLWYFLWCTKVSFHVPFFFLLFMLDLKKMFFNFFTFPLHLRTRILMMIIWLLVAFLMSMIMCWFPCRLTTCQGYTTTLWLLHVLLLVFLPVMSISGLCTLDSEGLTTNQVFLVLWAV